MILNKYKEDLKNLLKVKLIKKDWKTYKNIGMYQNNKNLFSKNKKIKKKNREKKEKKKLISNKKII